MTEYYSFEIQNIIQKELFKATKSIKIAVAWLTNDLLFQPLLMKLQMGVSVELIINKDGINCGDANDVDFNEFESQGGVLHWNDTKTLLHDKFCIIDDNVIISGSYNWTNKAEYNEESIAVTREESSALLFWSNKFAQLAAKYPASENSNNTTNVKIVKNAQDRKRIESDLVKLNQEIEGGGKNLFRIVGSSNCIMSHSGQLWDDLFKVGNFWCLQKHNSGKYVLYDVKKDSVSDYEFEEIEYGDFFYEYKYREHASCYLDCVKLSGHDDYKIKNNDRYGIIAGNGDLIIECIYDDITFEESARDHHKGKVYGFFKVRNGTKYGVINMKGSVIVPCEYEKIRIWGDGHNGLITGFSVWKNNHCGYYSALFNHIIECVYKSIVDLQGGETSDPGHPENIFAVQSYDNDKYALFVNGENVSGFIYDEIRWEAYFIDEDPCLYFDVFMVRSGNKWGVIDETGKYQLKCVYDRIEFVIVDEGPIFNYFIVYQNGKSQKKYFHK